MAAAGALDMMWAVAYENGDPLLGDSLDVENAARWRGPQGVLTKALLEAGGSTAGFIEEVNEEPGRYQVHDLWDHAPQYVRKRCDAELQREATGESLAEARARAGRAGAIAKRDLKNQAELAANALAGVATPAYAPHKHLLTPPAPAPAPAPVRMAVSHSAQPASGKPKKAKKSTLREHSPAAVGLKNEYGRQRNGEGLTWFEELITDKHWEAFEKAVEFCSRTNKQPKKLLEYSIKNFPGLSHGRGKFPPPGALVYGGMLDGFLVWDETGTSVNSNSPVHDSVAIEKKYENYPKDLAEQLRQAGLPDLDLAVVKEESRIGRVVLGVQRELEKLPSVSNLMYPLHVCYLASTQRPVELKQWVASGTKPSSIVPRQWVKVQEFARSQARNGHSELWMPLLDLAKELEVQL
jgi:hypothetical protein